MTPSDLEKLERLVEAATKGPWHIGHISELDDSAVIDNPELLCVGRINTQADQAFVCRARTAMPNLIAEVKRLQQILDTLKTNLQAQWKIIKDNHTGQYLIWDDNQWKIIPVQSETALLAEALKAEKELRLKLTDMSENARLKAENAASNDRNIDRMGEIQTLRALLARARTVLDDHKYESYELEKEINAALQGEK